jgi:HAD superfamily hydrolase (TIGR01490 family)
VNPTFDKNGNDKKSKRIALFDFDGTLTRRDTFWEFHATHFGRYRVAKALLAMSLSLLAPSNFKWENFGREAMKAAFLRALWAGVPAESYRLAARNYARGALEKNLRPLAMRVFLGHIERGDDVWIVTASMRDWVAFWAERYGVPVIGTEFEVENGVLTGRLATPNCRGREKVVRIRQAIDLSAYSKVFAYGDSGGDREMLALADEPVYRWNRVPALDE